MTQNPYAQFGGGAQPYGGDFIDPEPTRTSVLAIIGLVVSIVGCVACVIPGPGAVAATLGGLGLFFIARSAGRLRGTGLAVAAIVLGLFQSVFWIAGYTGARQVLNQAGSKFFIPVSETMTAIDHGDMPGSRALLTKEAAAAISDDMVRDFAKKYHDKVGSFQKTPQGVVDAIQMWTELTKNVKGGQVNINSHGNIPTIPLPARFDKGLAFVAIAMDPTAPQRGQGGKKPPLLNIGILTLDGTEIWLLDPDQATKLFNANVGHSGRHGAPQPVPAPPDAPAAPPGGGEGEPKPGS